MPATITAKVVVVGGGPGGYVAAIRCGQLGLDTILIDEQRLGGTCLLRGCIPSKAMIHAASQFAVMTETASVPHLGISLAAPPQIDFAATVRWKDGIVGQLSDGVAGLLKRAKVRVLQGRAHFTDGKTCRVTSEAGESIVVAEHVILATGSVAAQLPALEFGGPVISSAEALSLAELPKRLVVVGGGYIGVELGTAFSKLGVAVTIVEAQAQILPNYDKELVAPVRAALARRGVAIHVGATALGLDASGTALRARTAAGETLSLPADLVLVTVGRLPATQGWGLDAMSVQMDGRFIKVDERCATSMKNVWAIGDLVGEPLLAHKASAQGEMVAEIIAGHRRRFDPATIASVCFTDPEIVSAGLGPDAAEPDLVVSSFPLRANGRALSMDAGRDGGFVRVVSRGRDRRILGVQAVGQHVAELASAFVCAIEMGAVLEDIAGTIHVHPTLGEAFHEAALKGLGHAIHI